MKKFLLLIVFAALCFVSTTKACTESGMTISYEYTGNGNDYIFRVKYVRDCFGIVAWPTRPIQLSSATCALNITSNLQLVSFSQVPLNTCAQTGTTTCQGGSTLGLEEYIYEGVVTVPPCIDWIVSTSVYGRHDLVTNIIDPSYHPIYVDARFDNLNFPGNSSPRFNSSPVNYYCAGVPSVRDYGAFDVDGDSLHYELVNVLQDSTIVVPMATGFTYDQPLAASVPSYLDPINGMLIFTPSMVQLSMVGVKISEYRNGVLIGTIRADEIIAVTTVTALSDTIIGRVYIDQNSNGVFDPSDQAVPNLQMQLSPGDLLTTTDGNGKYEFFTNNGIWDVIIPNSSQYTTLNPASIIVNTNGISFSDSNDFIVELIPNMHDLEINLNRSHTPVPGNTYPLYISYKNSGTTTPTNVDVTLTLDPLLQFMTASTPPTNIVGNTLTWTIPSALPLIMEDINVLTSINLITTPGTPISCMANIIPMGSDLSPLNNIDYVIDTIATSYNPNFKEVSPAGDVDLAFITTQDWLTYRIYFQNLGTVPAQMVRISDLLDPDLELSSLEFVTSSFPCTMKYTNPNQLEFTFYGINLPSVSIDEPGSHGFVEYRVRPKATLLPGMYITNNAGIYFDLNAPVYTNLVHNKVVTSVGIEENSVDEDPISVYPNPATDYCILEINSSDSRVVEIEIYNLMGALVKKHLHQLSGGINRVTIPVMEISNGEYFVLINGKEKRLVSKISIIRN